LGTLTQNRAGIYFDYNKPIITNYATTVLALRVNNEEELSSEIEIFPNPSTGIFQIKHENLTIQQVQLFDLRGQMLMEKGEQTDILDLHDLSQGIYILEVQTDQGILTEKIIKQ
ncbi:MAG: T9SS type A sorting domain-containing protein, partial [Bacteroidota bacterium]